MTWAHSVFDVSKARAMYTPPAGYSVFAGKDASRGLAKSSLKPEDCVANINGLSEEEVRIIGLGIQNVAIFVYSSRWHDFRLLRWRNGILSTGRNMTSLERLLVCTFFEVTFSASDFGYEESDRLNVD